MHPTERPTTLAHRQVAAVLREGDLAIDATAGNGHDTVFLAERVGDPANAFSEPVRTRQRWLSSES